MNEIAPFWISFFFTWPFGACFGDLLMTSIEKDDFDLSTAHATIVSIGLIAGRSGRRCASFRCSPARPARKLGLSDPVVPLRKRRAQQIPRRQAENSFTSAGTFPASLHPIRHEP